MVAGGRCCDRPRSAAVGKHAALGYDDGARLEREQLGDGERLLAGDGAVAAGIGTGAAIAAERGIEFQQGCAHLALCRLCAAPAWGRSPRIARSPSSARDRCPRAVQARAARRHRQPGGPQRAGRPAAASGGGRARARERRRCFGRSARPSAPTLHRRPPPPAPSALARTGRAATLRLRRPRPLSRLYRRRFRRCSRRRRTATCRGCVGRNAPFSEGPRRLQRTRTRRTEPSATRCAARPSTPCAR